jgi:hypothetical protein
MQIQRDFDMP